jgi:hypothetical protein
MAAAAFQAALRSSYNACLKAAGGLESPTPLAGAAFSCGAEALCGINPALG